MICLLLSSQAIFFFLKEMNNSSLLQMYERLLENCDTVDEAKTKN